MIKNHGYIEDQRNNPQDHELGGLGDLKYPAINPSGQWLDFLPEVEHQAKNGVETSSCVSFTLCNIKEILERFNFKKSVNSSDRYLAIASQTSPTGNNPSKVCETARNIAGFIPEELLPFNNDIGSWEDYMKPQPLNKKYYDEGRRWLAKNELLHAWNKTDPDSLIEGLKRSPLMVSVVAWESGPDGKYIRPPGQPDGHATALIGYEWGEYWLIFDSYPAAEGSYLKRLDWNFGFGMAKCFRIELIQKVGWWQKLTKWFSNLLK